MTDIKDDRSRMTDLLKAEPRPRSSISPTPRSLGGHTRSSVRFSDAAESYSYSSTFEDAPTETREVSQWDDQYEPAVTGRTSYTDTFASETSLTDVRVSESQTSLPRRSLQSLDESSIGASYSDTFEATSTNKPSRARDPSSSGYSLYSSEADRDSQSTVKSVRDSHRRLKTEDTQSSLRSRYDYTDSFETSDLSTSEEESDTGLPTMSEDDARYEFVRRLLDRLRGEKDESARRSIETISQGSAKHEETKVSVSSISSKYCQEKIRLLRRKKKYGLDYRRQKDISPVKEKVSVTEYGFHPSIIDKLKTKSFMAAMDRATNAEIHEPRNCTECRIALQEVEGREQEKVFIRGKVADLQRKMMEDKICNHLVNMDSVTLIAEILRDLPRLSDSPALISKRLNQPLEDHQDSVETSLTNAHPFL